MIEKQELEELTIAGKATPNSVVTLYIYSDLPLVVTVEVDKFGNWIYELKEALTDGEHEVFVALNSESGKVVAKSNPLSFFVKEAKAIGIYEYIAEKIIPNSPDVQDDKNILSYYLKISLIVISVGLIVFVVVMQRRKKINEN